jgi:hypothetical protein
MRTPRGANTTRNRSRTLQTPLRDLNAQVPANWTLLQILAQSRINFTNAISVYLLPYSKFLRTCPEAPRGAALFRSLRRKEIMNPNGGTRPEKAL